MKKNILIWVHEDAINQDHPLFKEVENCQQNQIFKIFIWDKKYFKKRNYSLKRLVFIFESLLETDFEIIADDDQNELNNQIETTEIITKFCQQNAIEKIYSAKTNNQELKIIQKKLSEKFDHQIIADESFAAIDENKKFSRFFSFWKEVSKLQNF